MPVIKEPFYPARFLAQSLPRGARTQNRQPASAFKYMLVQIRNFILDLKPAGSGRANPPPPVPTRRPVVLRVVEPLAGAGAVAANTSSHPPHGAVLPGTSSTAQPVTKLWKAAEATPRSEKERELVEGYTKSLAAWESACKAYRLAERALERFVDNHQRETAKKLEGVPQFKQFQQCANDAAGTQDASAAEKALERFIADFESFVDSATNYRSDHQNLAKARHDTEDAYIASQDALEPAFHALKAYWTSQGIVLAEQAERRPGDRFTPPHER